MFNQLERCATEVERIESHPTGIGGFAVGFIAALRPHLPLAIDRKIAFTSDILVPPATSLRRVAADCPAP